MVEAVIMTLCVASLLVLLHAIHCHRVKKAVDLGFVYCWELSHNHNRLYARRLAAYATMNAETFEANMYLPSNYIVCLIDFGFDSDLAHSLNVFEIADRCDAICKALKC